MNQHFLRHEQHNHGGNHENFRLSEDVTRALFHDRTIPLEILQINSFERTFLERINVHIESKTPLVPILCIDQHKRTMWNTALSRAFPGVEFHSLKGSAVRGSAASPIKHCRYVAKLEHYQLRFHCLLLTESNNRTGLPCGIYMYNYELARIERSAHAVVEHGPTVTTNPTTQTSVRTPPIANAVHLVTPTNNNTVPTIPTVTPDPWYRLNSLCAYLEAGWPEQVPSQNSPKRSTMSPRGSPMSTSSSKDRLSPVPQAA